jgi:hypothetical protein
MSRIIEVSNIVIKQPELLPKAIDYLNDLKQYGVVNANYKTDKDGRILDGFFHLESKDSVYGKGKVFLRYEGKGQPVYDVEGILQSGHFRLMGDEDFQENKSLANLISDHYTAQVLKSNYEAEGREVLMTVDPEEGILLSLGDEQMLAASNY